MTHIVNPYAHRLGGIRDWKSKWTFNKNSYINFLKTDTFVRDFLEKKLEKAYVSDIEFSRDGSKKYTINIKSSRVGMIIGKSGDGIEKLLKDIKKLLKKKKLEIPVDIKINIEDIKSPESDAGIVVAQVVEALEKRMPFKRIMKTTVEKCMANRNVQGVKVALSGRLNGADMARRESEKQGRIPLSTFRADIDFRNGRANLPYGVIGVKVWIYRGDIFQNKKIN